MKASKKAPKVAPPNKKKPNYMNERSVVKVGKGPQTPMSHKKLSKQPP